VGSECQFLEGKVPTPNRDNHSDTPRRVVIDGHEIISVNMQN